MMVEAFNSREWVMASAGDDHTDQAGVRYAAFYFSFSSTNVLHCIVQ